MNDLTGEWKESNLGTSTGTVLETLLFILHVYDSPEPIDPKFADDFTSVAMKDTVKKLEETLQGSINVLESWSYKNDMCLNQEKTQVLIFGREVDNEIISLRLNNLKKEQKE